MVELLIVWLLLAAISAQGATYYVSPAGSDANSGTSWALAKQTIQAGINVATSGDTVLVADGTYSPITISPGITVRSVNGAQTTIIDGGGVTRCAYLYTNAVLDGFTVTNGYSSYSAYSQWPRSDGGGGVYSYGGTVQNCTISGNTAEYAGHGGGICVYGGTVQNCIISGNWAWSGGGVCAYDCIVQNCTINGNWASCSGGGVEAGGGTVQVQNCTIIGNTASIRGGGMELWYGMAQNCTIIGNTASERGGGVCVWVGTVRNFTISGNTAGYYGGGVFASGSTVQNCTIRGNVASYGGGAKLWYYDTLQNCIISGNTANYGGGVSIGHYGNGTVRNCLISGNAAVDMGGGVWAMGGEVENCTIARNTIVSGEGDSGVGGGIFVGGGTIRNCIAYYNQDTDVVADFDGPTPISNSCISSDIGGIGNITNEPQFISNGTGYGAEFVPGNYRLRQTSPCINIGTNQPWMANAGDLDGVPRIVGGVVDMGAYEFTTEPGTVQFSTSSYSVNEDARTVTLTVTRTGGSYGLATVEYATADGTASAGSDYTSQSGILSWSYGDTANKTITVSVTDDSIDENDETFTVTLSNAIGAGLGSPNSATVTIVDNDTPGTIQFERSSYSVNEDAGTVMLTVTRTGGSAGLATVEFATAAGTALAGLDYTSQSGTLTWPDGDTSSKTITLSITDDSMDENDETFTVTLSNVTGADLGSPDVATVTIVDNDIPPDPEHLTDLEVSDFKFVPVNLWAGDHPAMISFDLVNGGPADLVASDTQLAITFYLSSNQTFGDADDIAIGTKIEVLTLPAGDQTTIRYPGRAHNEDVTIPEGLTGDYYVFVNVRLASSAGLSDPDGAYAMRDGPINVRIHPADGGEDTDYRQVVNDYDGDGLSDMMSYDEPSGEWTIRLSASGDKVQFVFGGPGYEQVSGDYDGDSKTDPAIHDRQGSAWTIMLSELDYQKRSFNFGGEGETKGVVGDYDKDGLADPGLYEEGSGRWSVLLSYAEDGNGGMASAVFGGLGFAPLAGDYDGDGKVDPAVYGEATGNWMVLLSGQGYGVVSAVFGGLGYAPVVGDYDGDGKADPMLFNQATGEWTALMSASGYALQRFASGLGIPVAGDFDGDGIADPAVLSTSGGWSFLSSLSAYARLGPYSLTSP
ncbi:MAG: right-handed parallel beta-helix repeat-containing protein [Lentisphaerae bacterium]|nr:right-handed parallel beta-helix repeat-containing protein [Lentisphaerota bacterium]